MIRWKYAFALCLACLWVGSGVMAQESYYEQLSVKDGLTHNRINHIFQDSYGYIWAATAHGLNQLDGYSVQSFRYSPSDPNSLPANYLLKVYEAPDGDLWTTPGIGGIARFDRDSRNFRTFPLEDPNKKESFWIVYDVIWTEDGEMWLGGNHGLYYYQPKRDTIFQETIEWEEEFPDLAVIKLVEREGNLILGTNYGLYRYDRKSRKVTKMPVFLNGDKKETEFWVTNFLEDSKGRLWAATKGAGLLRSDDDHFVPLVYGDHPAKKSYVTTLTEDGDGRIWFGDCKHGIWYLPEDAAQPLKFPTEADVCEVICPDDGACWGHSYPDQLVKLDLQTLKAIPGKPRALNSDPPNTDFINAWMFDRENNLWIGSFEGGLFRQSPQKEVFHTFSEFRDLGASDFVTAIKSDHEGKIWVRTRTDLLTSIDGGRSFKKLKSEGVPLGLEVDAKGRIWSLTTEGLEERNSRGDVVKSYPKESFGKYSQYEGPVYLYSDREDNLWFVSSKGLFCFNPETEATSVISALDSTIENAHLIGNPFILYQDKAGTYWVGVVKYGLVKMEFDKGEEGMENIKFTSHVPLNLQTNPLGSMTVSEIFEDVNGTLWVGAYSNGLMSFDRETAEFKYFLLPDGNPVPNIKGILPDQIGHLWISSSAGLFRFHPENETYRQYTYEDGLQSNLFSHHAYCKGPDNRLYFGGIDGFNVFDPQKVALPAYTYAPEIREIRVMGDPVKMDLPYEEARQIVLEPGQNMLSIDFGAVHFSYPEKIKYAYRLVGLDNEWVETREREISYRHLPAGKYAFQVRATVEGMDWGDSVREIEVFVKPPFYRTAWFFALLGVFIAIVATSVHFYRIRTRERKFREIEAIRKKAAADFHDELGHRLTRISLFSEVLQRKVNGSDPEVQSYLEKIKVNSQDLYHSMRNFLWALDPEKDSAFELAVLLKDFGDEMFDRTGISFTMAEIPEDLKKISLNMDWKRHLVLIFKEALHNVLKHSDGQNVMLSVKAEGEALSVTLQDDGKGFKMNGKSPGFGIRNMTDRAEKIDCNLDIDSKPGVGTRITFHGELPVVKK